MLDQTFSSTNFRRIYDEENRRGRNLDQRYFPTLTDASARITAASARIRDCRRNHQHVSDEELQRVLQPLYDDLRDAREARETRLAFEIEQIAALATSRGFRVSLETATGPNEMPIFPIADESATYFISKQLQRNLSRLYHLKPGDRRAIVRQVKDILSTDFNLYVVRTDITSFYESIDRQELIFDIDKDQLLSLTSKHHIKSILNCYGQLSGNEKGIPRGVGISAYLSELYMRGVDSRIKQIEGLTFYARYVDDILAIFSPTAMTDNSTYLSLMKSEIEARGLSINEQKTKCGPAPQSSSFHFEYLGYEFTWAGGCCELEMSNKKMDRYRMRIDRCFQSYSRTTPINQRKAERLLVARIKYLTGNTRLVNNKGFAFTGIYYNNSELTKLGKLNGLDAYLRHKVQSIYSASLQDRILAYSFRRGFEQKPFYRYNTIEFSNIVKAWRYES